MRVVQCLCDIFHYRVRIDQHVIVPETQYPVAFQHEKGGPPLVGLALPNVLATIELHHKFLLWAAEVRNVSTNRMLTPELGSAHLSSP